MTHPRRACAALLCFAAFIAAPAAAVAQGINTPFLVARVKAATPQCRDHPDAPVVGHVSGIMTGSPGRGVSFTGCFATMAACEAWRRPVSGLIAGRLILDRCDTR